MLSFFFREGGMGPDSGEPQDLVDVDAYMERLNGSAGDRIETDVEAFLRELQACPWPTLMAAWLQRQEGPLPALVLCNSEGDAQLGISGVFHDPHRYYQCTYEGLVRKGWFARKRMQASFEIHAEPDVTAIVRNFASGDYDALRGGIERVGQNVLS